MAGSVLLVHDDIAAIAAVRRLLSREGFEVILATSAADAIISFGHELPSLILLAPSVESQRGHLVLEELAQHPDSKLARIVLLGETIPGWALPVVPFPLDGPSFLETVQESMRSPPEPNAWQMQQAASAQVETPPEVAPAIAPEAWRTTGPLEVGSGAPTLESDPTRWQSVSDGEEEDRQHLVDDAERARQREEALEAAFEQTHQEMEAEAIASVESSLPRFTPLAEEEPPVEEWDPFPPSVEGSSSSAGLEVEAAPDDEARVLEEQVHAEALRRRMAPEEEVAFEEPAPDPEPVDLFSDFQEPAPLLDPAVVPEPEVRTLDTRIRSALADPADLEPDSLRGQLEELARAPDRLRADAERLEQEGNRQSDVAAEAHARLEGLQTRGRAAQGAAARARELADAARHQSLLAAQRSARERELEEEARRLERESHQQTMRQLALERQQEQLAEQQERERLAQELDESRVATELARAQVEEAHRLTALERASREAEHQARRAAEEQAENAREQARSLELKAEAALFSLARPGGVEHIPRVGSASIEKLAQWVIDLCAARAQARIELSSEDGLRVVWLGGGGLVGAVSSVPRESVLDRARQDGLIDSRQDSELRLFRTSSSGELVDLMRTRGYLRESEVVPLVQRYAEQVALDALSEAESQYRLSEDPMPREIPRVATARPIVQLVVEGLRRGLDPQTSLEALGGLRAIPELSLQAHLGIEQLNLPEAERRLLRSVDGELSVERLLLQSGLRQDIGLRAMAVGQALGIVSMRLPSSPEPVATSFELDVQRLEAKFEEVQSADYFSVLGISREAGRDEVTRAYQLLAHEFHPLRYAAHADVSIQRRAEHIREALTEAAQALGDDRLRAQYARSLVD